MPLLQLLSGDTSEHIPEGMLGHLGLSVGLRVTRATIIEGRVEPPPKSFPKVTEELYVLVGSDSLWYTIQPDNFSKEEMGYVEGIQGLLARDEMRHFGEPIYYHKNGIHTLLGPRESEHKIHTQVFPNTLGHWKWSV
jgi:hypothetical protein